MDRHVSHHTFLELVARHHHLLGKAGIVVIKYMRGNDEALDMYVAKLDKLERDINEKIADVEGADKKKDLKIMRDEIRLISEHFKGLRPTNHVTGGRSVTRTVTPVRNVERSPPRARPSPGSPLRRTYGDDF